MIHLYQTSTKIDTFSEWFSIWVASCCTSISASFGWVFWTAAAVARWRNLKFPLNVLLEETHEGRLLEPRLWDATMQQKRCSNGLCKCDKYVFQKLLETEMKPKTTVYMIFLTFQSSLTPPAPMDPLWVAPESHQWHCSMSNAPGASFHTSILQTSGVERWNDGGIHWNTKTNAIALLSMSRFFLLELTLFSCGSSTEEQAAECLMYVPGFLTAAYPHHVHRALAWFHIEIVQTLKVLVSRNQGFDIENSHLIHLYLMPIFKMLG